MTFFTWAGSLRDTAAMTKRRAAVLMGISVLLALGSGCGRKAHDAADSGTAVDAALASPDGVNAADVQRFAEDAPIDHEAAKITKFATVIVSPPSGRPVVALDTGTEVQKLAVHGAFVLITFTHPRTSDKTMGWVPIDTVSASPSAVAHVTPGHVHSPTAIVDAGSIADAGKAAVATVTVDAGKPGPKKQCPAGQALTKVLDSEECLKICKAATDCPTNTFCTSAVLVDPPGHTAKLCFKVSN